MQLCSWNHSEELLLNEAFESRRPSSFFRGCLSEYIGKSQAPERKESRLSKTKQAIRQITVPQLRSLPQRKGPLSHQTPILFFATCELSAQVKRVTSYVGHQTNDRTISKVMAPRCRAILCFTFMIIVFCALERNLRCLHSSLTPVGRVDLNFVFGKHTLKFQGLSENSHETTVSPSPSPSLNSLFK